MRCEACGSSHHEDEAYTCSDCLVLCFDAKPNGLGGHYGFYDEEDNIWTCNKCTRAKGYCDDDLSDSTVSTTEDDSATTRAPLGQLNKGRLESNSPNFEPGAANHGDAGQGGTKAVGSCLTSPFSEAGPEIAKAAGQLREAPHRTYNGLNMRNGGHFHGLKVQTRISPTSS